MITLSLCSSARMCQDRSAGRSQSRFQSRSVSRYAIRL